MREEIDARLWADHGSEFTTAVWQWIAELSAAFIRLNERNYAAPWKNAEPHGRTVRSA